MAVTIFTTFLYRNIIDQIQLGISEFTPQLNTFLLRWVLVTYYLAFFLLQKEC